MEPLSVLLRDGDPQACGHPDVMKRITDDMNENSDAPTVEWFARSYPQVTQDDIDQAVKDVGELKPGESSLQQNKAGVLTCAVKFHINDKSPDGLIVYDLEASSGPTGFSIDYPDPIMKAEGALRSAISLQAILLASARRENAGANRSE